MATQLTVEQPSLNLEKDQNAILPQSNLHHLESLEKPKLFLWNSVFDNDNDDSRGCALVIAPSKEHAIAKFSNRWHSEKNAIQKLDDWMKRKSESDEPITPPSTVMCPSSGSLQIRDEHALELFLNQLKEKDPLVFELDDPLAAFYY